MNKYIQTLTNARGDVLPGDRLQVVTSAGAVVDIYADDGSTPFTDENGAVVNYATADLNGLVQFYWTPADGHVLQQLDTSGSLRRAITDFAKPFLLSEFGGEVAQAQVTDLVTDLAAKAATADLASTDPGKGAALVAGAGKIVATRAAMAALTSAADKARPLQLIEGVPALNSRAGTFVWDASDLSAEVTIDTAQGIYVPPSSDATGASGAWVRQFDGAFNVAWFGAVDDDATDNSTALANALAALPTEGGDILIPRTNSWWRFASDIDLGQKKRLVGFGAGSRIKLNGCAIKVDAISGPETRPYWGIEKLRIERIGTAGPCIQLLGQAGSAHAPIRSTIRDVLITASTGDGIQSKGAYLIDMFGTVIQGCAGIGLYLGMDDARTVGPNAWKIFGGEIQGNATGAFIDTALNVSFFGTAFEGNSVKGVDSSLGNRNVGFYNCYFEQNGGADIEVGAGGVGNNGLKISNCNFMDATSGKDYAIILNNGAGVAVENCIFDGYAVAGVNRVGGSVSGYERGNVLTSGTPVVVSSYISTFRKSTEEAALAASVVHDWPSIAAGASATQTFTVTGVAVGDIVLGCSVGSGATAGLQVTCSVTAADTVTVTITNTTGAPIDLPNATMRFVVLPRSTWGIS